MLGLRARGFRIAIIRFTRWRLSVAFAAFLTSTSAAFALSGVAMVIGNSKYEHLPALTNPANDARSIETLLSTLGFETELSSDRDARRLKRDLDIFLEDAEGADVAVLYYAGHGIEAGGQNFLVPVDADISSLDNAGERLVPLSDYLQKLQATVPVTIILLDACRDNPFPPGMEVRMEPSSAPMEIGQEGLSQPRSLRPLAAASKAEKDNFGTVIAYAAAPGHTALDGKPGDNSPYTAAILRHFSTMTGEEFGLVMRMVAEEVYLKTDGRQHPWVNESLRRLLYFGTTPPPVAGFEGQILDERRQLLVTISELPSQRRDLVHRLADENGVRMDALFAMLKSLGQKVPDDPGELNTLLRRLAVDLKQTEAQRATLSSADPEIKRLTALANKATEEGAIETAVSIFEKAKARVRELESTVETAEDAIRARRTEFAEVFARSAEARAVALDHAGAAEDFAEAAKQVDRWDEALAWQYRYRQALALRDHGVIRGDTPALQDAIGLLEDLERDARKDDERLRKVRLALADVLTDLGGRQTTNEALERAVSLYRDLLGQGGDADVADKLGSALLALGRREIGTERLQQASSYLGEALAEQSRDDAPLKWAAIQSGLADAEVEIWKRSSGDPDKLAPAIGHFRAALAVLGDEPGMWARTQLRLGRALRLASQYQESVDAYDAVMNVCDRAAYPVCWAAAQQGKGVSLYELGSAGKVEASSDAEKDAKVFSIYRLSLVAFENALSEQRLDMTPLDWAETYSSRAEMLRTFAWQSAKGINLIYLAEAAHGYEQALAAINAESLPAMWYELSEAAASTYEDMAYKEKRLERLGGYLRKSVLHTRESLKGISREADVKKWAEQQNRLSDRLLMEYLVVDKQAKKQAVGLVDQAMDASREAIGAFTAIGDAKSASQARVSVGEHLIWRSLDKNDVAGVREARQYFEEAWEQNPGFRDFGYVDIRSGVGAADTMLRKFDAGRLEAAVADYRGRLTDSRRASDPRGWAQDQYDLAGVLDALSDLREDAGLRSQAVEALRQSLLVWTVESAPVRFAWAQQALGDLLRKEADKAGKVDLQREAVAAYEAALQVLTDDYAPSQHDELNRTAAEILTDKIGLPENDTQALQGAIGHYEAMLSASKFQHGKATLSEIHEKIGDVALQIYWNSWAADHARKAADAFRTSLGLLDADTNPARRNDVENKLAIALAVLGEAEHDMQTVREAVRTYGEVIDAYEKQDRAVEAAFARSNMARAIMIIGEAESDLALYRQGVAEMRKAMTVLDKQDYPDNWVWCNQLLGVILGDIAEETGEGLDEAAAAYHEVLDLRPRETYPSDWAEATLGLAHLAILGAGDDSAGYEEGIRLTRAAIEVYKERSSDYDLARGDVELCLGYAGVARTKRDMSAATTAVEACERGLKAIETFDRPVLLRIATKAQAQALAVRDELK